MSLRYVPLRRLHNSRIRQIAKDLDLSVVDLASLCCNSEDFANPLELSSRGGCKVVENLSGFVRDNPPSSLPRLMPWRQPKRESESSFLDVFFGTAQCCACAPRRTYANQQVSEDLIGGTKAQEDQHPPSDFAQAQERWRHS
ncbi:unnamed protein product [Effrenium voratum]|nr:unnamed protein product [Effrenium voratum]